MTPLAALLCVIGVFGGALGEDPADAPAPPPTLAPADVADDAPVDRAAPAPDAVSRDVRSTFSPVPAVPLAALQCGGGCALLVAVLPLSLVCTTGVCLGGPMLLGYFQTYIGDRLGPDRAPAIVPIVTSYVGFATAAVAGASVFALGSYAGQPQDVVAPAALASAGAVVLLTVAAIPIAYRLAASPKDPRDDGSEPPDFMAPRVPLEVRRRANQ